MMNFKTTLLFLFFGWSILLISQPKKSSADLKSTKNESPVSNQNISKLKGFPVIPFRDTLFFVYNKIGSFNAENRANAITSRIELLYKDPFFSKDSLLLTKSDFGVDIVYKSDFVVMSVTDLDGKTMGSSNFALAQKNLAIIQKAVLFQKENNAVENWLKRIGLVLLLITLIIAIVFAINKLFSWFRTFLVNRQERYFSGIKIRGSYILIPEKHLEFVLRIARMIRIVVLIFTFYISLPAIFSVFPETEDYATTLLKWIFTPAKTALMGFLNFLPNLISILVIIVLFQYLLKAIKFFVDEIEKGQIKIEGFYSDWAKPTFNIIKVLIYAFMLVIIFPYLPGSNSPIFQGVSVFVGVLFSLGSSNAIANMIAGLVITYMRPFKIGDFIKIGDVSGTVIEKTALVTRVRTPKQEDITIPNATVLSSSSINYSANTDSDSKGLLIHTKVTIGYDCPWNDVQKALVEAALRTDLLEKIPAPFVLQTSLDDFYVAYEINAYTKQPNQQPTIYSKLHQNIQDCFNEAGLEIMSPHYNSHRDGNKTTIPENYLDKEYKASPFNVKIGE
ncbi:mechanosensitive ion channel family protein [Flavobacterium granuli]|uniref:Small-conductance mechanosensitive channel n=1 Tax=Flavobacterium granuli TaxID=280093 RepID=A0ABU1S059_9FLAO|nr:mechanosensitive ion channel family protein [Flavobacterium granuli]MDR6843590.1 small-conductance mechanosensitive channel [Flavobacterium granuli]